MAEALWSALPIPALVIDPGDLVAEVNPATETFLNMSRRAMIGQPFAVLCQLSVDILPALSRARDQDADLFIGDAQVAGKGVAPVLCSVHITPSPSEPGYMVVAIAPREMGVSAARSRVIDAAAQSAIGMAEMLAHEIKNPLAGIAGAAQLLSMELDKQGRDLTDLIVSETRRINALIDQVEDFGNLQPPGDAPVNLHDVLTRAKRSAELGFAAHMKIIEEYDPSLPEARGDADQLVQVVLNLLKNAAEAQPVSGTIWVRTAWAHAARIRRGHGDAQKELPLMIEIVDDGPGLPPEIADIVFEPFVSGRENGTGLGLALVSKIINAHEGWVSLSVEDGQTRFRLWLPRAEPSDAGGAATTHAADTHHKE